MKNNTYLPFRSEILEVIKHADLEYTFRMAYDRGAEHPVKPGQFFEISIPKYGEAPISSAASPTIPWISPSGKWAA